MVSPRWKSCSACILSLCLHRCKAESMISQQDAAVMLQHGVGTNSQRTEGHADHILRLVSQALRTRFLSARSLAENCTETPALCKPPLNCHEAPLDIVSHQIATADGHGNYHSWCGSPYTVAVAECVAGNYSGYGKLLHQAQLKFEPSFVAKQIEHIDAHYCFSYGHCDNANFTANTTLEESEAMCDRRFGHESWAKMTGERVFLDMVPAPLGGDLSFSDGGAHLGRQASKNFAMLSCAQGNYMCDGIYCKQEYCSDPHWSQKLGHLRHREALKA